MNSKSRAPVWLATLTTAVAAGLLIVAGCALDKNGSHPGNVFTRIGGHSGQLIEPKRCLLKVAILTRPFGDPTINEVVWRVADEQIIPPAETAGLGSQRPAGRPDHRRPSPRARSDPQGDGSSEKSQPRPTFSWTAASRP